MFNSERFARWLDENNITQYRCARMTGLHHSTISRIISGIIDPGAKTISKICQFTGMTPNEILIVPPGREWHQKN